MLDLIPAIQEPGFVAATWTEGHASPVYHAVVDQFFKLCSGTTVQCDPYAVLPEDPAGVEAGTRTLGVLRTPQDMSSASLGQIRRYFILCTRGERFCDGFLDEQLTKGVFLAALLRLRELNTQ